MGRFEDKKLSGEDRRNLVIVLLSSRNMSTDLIAHGIWPDWRGPHGKGSHPLCRPTGKILSLMKKDGLVEEVYNDLRKRYEWKLIRWIKK